MLMFTSTAETVCDDSVFFLSVPVLLQSVSCEVAGKERKKKNTKKLLYKGSHSAGTFTVYAC